MRAFENLRANMQDTMEENERLKTENRQLAATKKNLERRVAIMKVVPPPWTCAVGA